MARTIIRLRGVRLQLYVVAIGLLVCGAGIDSTHQFIISSQEWTSQIQHPIVRRNIPIFYNAYLRPDADEDETARVHAIVKQQMSYLIPDVHYPVFVQTVGKELAIPNTILMGHQKQANEEVTLHNLWEYCRNHTDQAVIYMHTKGSFTASDNNDRLRVFVTRTALSRNCEVALRQDNTECNYCAGRFSPTPHPHTSGNMWGAKCSYVATLIDPMHFEQHMEVLPHLAKRRRHHVRVGLGRYAVEHWIASRGTTLRPCDLYNSPDYTWNYGPIPNLLEYNYSETLPPSMFELQPAPRFPWKVWTKPHHFPYEFSMHHRWWEYQELYNETPPWPDVLGPSHDKEPADLWWGWRLKEWVDEVLEWNHTPPPY